jgi:transcriptional regulator with XRE-family HTH domain
VNPVADLRCRAGLTQRQLAARAGTSQPAIAAYESAVKSPTLRTLGRLAAAAGFEAWVTYVAPLTREDRRALELHRAIAQRLRERPDFVLRMARRNLALMSSTNPGARPLLQEWRRLLRWPVDDLADALVDPRPRARDLRQVTPFAGVLSPSERWSALCRTSKSACALSDAKNPSVTEPGQVKASRRSSS